MKMPKMTIDAQANAVHAGYFLFGAWMLCSNAWIAEAPSGEIMFMKLISLMMVVSSAAALIASTREYLEDRQNRTEL